MSTFFSERSLQMIRWFRFAHEIGHHLSTLDDSVRAGRSVLGPNPAEGEIALVGSGESMHQQMLSSHIQHSELLQQGQLDSQRPCCRNIRRTSIGVRLQLSLNSQVNSNVKRPFKLQGVLVFVYGNSYPP